MNRIKDLRKKVRQIEKCLRSSNKFHEWLKSQDRSPEEKAAWSDLMLDIMILRGKLDNDELDILADEFDKLEPSLNEGITAIEKAVEEMEDFAKALETFGKVLGLIGKVVAVAVFPSPAPLIATAMRAKSAAFSADKAYFKKAGSAEMLAKSSVEEKIAVIVRPLPIEEVLHGIELTEKELIITVATGGCTTRDSFYVDVNKGFTGIPPYLVTVYRIVSDNCLMLSPPIQFSYSREELGLDGHAVEFILRNKIGNTSQHRLNS